MLKYLKIGTSALAVSALFLAPAVTVTFVTADSAYANNGNGNGNCGGGNRGGGKGGGASKGGDKGSDKGNKGANSKSASKGGFGKGLKDFGNSFKKDVGKLFGAKPQKTRPAAGKSVAAKEKGPTHPSNLGKLNGFINSSPNAKLAHIAKGQYMSGTGPVSLAAALTVAKFELGEEIGDYAEVADAESIGTATENVAMKEEDALAHYKGDFDSLDPEEQDQVREALHDSLPQDEAAIEHALDKYDEKHVDEDDDDVMADEDGIDEESSDQALVDETEPSDQS